MVQIDPSVAQTEQPLVQTGSFQSRVLPDSELSRLGIIKMADGSYYKASDGRGGAIVLHPVEARVLSASSSEAKHEWYQ